MKAIIDNENKARKITTSYFKIHLVIGLGYWRDVYSKEKQGMDGVAFNFIILCFRVQYSVLYLSKKDEVNMNQHDYDLIVSLKHKAVKDQMFECAGFLRDAERSLIAENGRRFAKQVIEKINSHD